MRIAVISPFLDRRHGTERVILEQIQRFAQLGDIEIHIYAQQLTDLEGVTRFRSPERKRSEGIFWHKIPSLPVVPHLFAYIWWFFANHLYRWWDARFHNLKYDLLYSPGINALNADVVAVHIVFHEFYRRIRSHRSLTHYPLANWPRLLHRRIYYRLIMMLERRVYPREATRLVAVSQLVSRHLQEFFQRSDACVIPNAVDTDRFTPGIRARRREAARAALNVSADAFVLLIIGNDWAKKGLETLLHSLGNCRDLPMALLIVGNDDRNIFVPLVDRLGLRDHVQFHGSTDDVEDFYAAADVYAGPSLEDSFALPPLEAMACGLPVITSVNNGGSQIITEGVDGFVLADPRDVNVLSALVRRLYQTPGLCSRIGENASRTAQQYTWERNANMTWEVLMASAAMKAEGSRKRENV